MTRWHNTREQDHRRRDDRNALMDSEREMTKGYGYTTDMPEIMGWRSPEQQQERANYMMRLSETLGGKHGNRDVPLVEEESGT